MKFGFVAKHRGIWPVDVLCEALGLSRSGFYAWRTRAESKRSRTDTEILVTVRSSFLLSDRTYGARRILGDVRDAGHACGRQRVARLMRREALRARPRRRARPTDTGNRPVHSLAPNVLDREFTAAAPNQKWVADFTYVWTNAQDGTNQPETLQYQGCSPRRCVRLHRTLLQPTQEALHARQHQPRKLRARGGSSLTHCLQNPVQLIF